MKKLLIVTIISIALEAFSQSPTIEWQKNFGGSSNEFISSIKQTSDGGYIVAGYSASTDGDLTSNNGSSDYWIVKLNNLGNIQWQRSYGGGASDQASSISQTTDGGYIVVGFTGSNSGDVTGNNGMFDGWVVKLNSAGNIQWQKALGGSLQDYLASIQQTSDGGYITVGSSKSNDGDLTNNQGNDDYWIVKLNASGNIQWQKSLGGSLQDYARSVQQTADGGYIISGTTASNDGDVTVLSGTADCWVVKLDSSGNLQWQKSIGGVDAEGSNSIQQTSDGGYILAGSTFVGNSSDCLIVKLNSLGEIQWQENYGGSANESAYSILQTNDTGYIFIAESTSNNGDLTDNNGNNDYWLVRLTNSGNLQWQKNIGGSDSDRGRSIDLTDEEEVIAAGSSRSSDGDSTNNYGLFDWWIVKLSCINPSLDLYIKDSFDDVGAEPNATAQNMWTSQDIWIRNDDDNGLVHQNPEYRSNNQPNYIYVRVMNKSCVASNGNETLTLNWAKANTALAWPQNWDGSLQNTGGYNLGGTLPSVNIPIIQANEEAIVKIPWIIPNPDNYLDNDNPWHFCLIARIDSTIDPLSSQYTTNPNIMVRNNNNQAWKNITIVDLVQEREIGGVIGVGNIYNQTKKYKLTFALDDAEIGKPLFEEAEIAIEMDDILYNIWEAGGKVGNNIKQTKEPKKVIIDGDNAYLGNLTFNSEDMGKLYLTFNFLTKELTNKNVYVYHVVQQDEDNNEVIGGETYIVDKSGSRTAFYANAGGTKEVNENEPIVITASDISEPALYNWYDENGNLIFQGKDLNVTTDITKKYKLEVIALSDGFKDYAEVEVKIKPSVIESISPNPTSNNLNIQYKINSASSAYLMIIDYYGSYTSNNYILDINSNNVVLDISSFPASHYNVALICDGEIVDAKTLIKQ